MEQNSGIVALPEGRMERSTRAIHTKLREGETLEFVEGRWMVVMAIPAPSSIDDSVRRYLQHRAQV